MNKKILIDLIKKLSNIAIIVKEAIDHTLTLNENKTQLLDNNENKLSLSTYNNAQFYKYLMININEMNDINDVNEINNINENINYEILFQAIENANIETIIETFNLFFRTKVWNFLFDKINPDFEGEFNSFYTIYTIFNNDDNNEYNLNYNKLCLIIFSFEMCTYFMHIYNNYYIIFNEKSFFIFTNYEEITIELFKHIIENIINNKNDYYYYFLNKHFICQMFDKLSVDLAFTCLYKLCNGFYMFFISNENSTVINYLEENIPDIDVINRLNMNQFKKNYSEYQYIFNYINDEKNIETKNVFQKYYNKNSNIKVALH